MHCKSFFTFSLCHNMTTEAKSNLIRNTWYPKISEIWILSENLLPSCYTKGNMCITETGIDNL